MTRSRPTILKRFNTKRPSWVNPEKFLDPRLQNLFEMSYFSDSRNSDGAVATGWGAVDDNKQLNTIASRLPESEAPADQDSPEDNEAWNNAHGSNESGSDEDSNAPTQTRMADESSEEEAVSYKVSSRSDSSETTEQTANGHRRT